MRKKQLVFDQTQNGRVMSRSRQDCRERKQKLADLPEEKPARAPLHTLLPFLEERLALTIPSDYKYLCEVLEFLSEKIVGWGIVEAEDSDVVLALDEAIVNAIKHGNKCDPHKSVHILAELSASGIRVTITDEGTGFSKEEVPDPTDPCRILEPSGRGLLLINHFMDEVCHNDCGNQIQMFKRSTQGQPNNNESAKPTS